MNGSNHLQLTHVTPAESIPSVASVAPPEASAPVVTESTLTPQLEPVQPQVFGSGDSENISEKINAAHRVGVYSMLFNPAMKPKRLSAVII